MCVCIYAGGLDYIALDDTLTLDSSIDRLRACTRIGLRTDDLLENPETFEVFGTATITTADGSMSTVMVGPETVTLLESTGHLNVKHVMKDI